MHNEAGTLETVAVTGGSGGIGQSLLEKLIDIYQVRALFRTHNAISEKWQKKGCHIVLGDLGNEKSLSELVAGAQFLFHCAAIVTDGSPKEAYEVNVEGTRRLADIAVKHGCKRFIHVSSIAVYNCAVDKSDTTESSSLSDNKEVDTYSYTKMCSEAALKETALKYDMEYVILRPTCVFGPYIKAFTIGPVELMRKGVPVIVGDGNGYLDAVYVEDVVGAMLLAAQSPRAHGEIFNIGNVNVTFKEFYSYYRHILRRPARHLPLALVHSILKMFEISPQFIKKKFPELKKGLVFLINMYSNTKLYPSTKAREILGYNPRFSLAMGMLKTELWIQQHYSLTTNRYSQRNYGPTYTFHPNMVIHPTTEEEIVQTIQTALHSKMRVRAIGSLHSFSRIPETDGICIILDNYNRLLKVNGNSVTVQAGMRIRDLHQHLAEHHLALPVNGSITEQTVSGAVSTATHGGSIHHGTISDYVESVRIVKADGHILEVATPHELLHAISVSMGTLGIISTITFNCIPSFNLKSDKLLCKTQEVIDNFESIQNNNDYVDMMYFPITDDIAILRTNRFDNELDHNNYDQNRITESDYAPKTKFSRWLTTIRLKLSLQILHKLNRNALQRRITQPLAHSYYKPRTGRSDFVLSFTDLDDIDPYPIQDMEIAIPYQQAGTAIHALRDHFATTQSYPLLPIHIRCSAQSHLWLSPSYKQDVCWIEFWQYPPSDHFFKQIHDVLAPFQYRFHWGKQSQASQEYIKAQYERWEDFVRLRDAWDPQGVFLNPRLDSWFCKKK